MFPPAATKQTVGTSAPKTSWASALAVLVEAAVVVSDFVLSTPALEDASERLSSNREFGMPYRKSQ